MESHVNFIKYIEYFCASTIFILLNYSCYFGWKYFIDNSPTVKVSNGTGLTSIETAWGGNFQTQVIRMSILKHPYSTDFPSGQRFVPSNGKKKNKSFFGSLNSPIKALIHAQKMKCEWNFTCYLNCNHSIFIWQVSDVTNNWICSYTTIVVYWITLKVIQPKYNSYYQCANSEYIDLTVS